MEKKFFLVQLAYDIRETLRLFFFFSLRIFQITNTTWICAEQNGDKVLMNEKIVIELTPKNVDNFEWNAFRIRINCNSLRKKIKFNWTLKTIGYKGDAHTYIETNNWKQPKELKSHCSAFGVHRRFVLSSFVFIVIFLIIVILCSALWVSFRTICIIFEQYERLFVFVKCLVRSVYVNFFCFATSVVASKT